MLQNAPPGTCSLSTNSDTLVGRFSVASVNRRSNAGLASSYSLSNSASWSLASFRSCAANASSKSWQRDISASASTNRTLTKLQSNARPLLSNSRTSLRKISCCGSMQSPERISLVQTTSNWRLRSAEVLAMISDTLVNVNRVWNPQFRPARNEGKSGSSARQPVPEIELVSRVMNGLYPMNPSPKDQIVFSSILSAT